MTKRENYRGEKYVQLLLTLLFNPIICLVSLFIDVGSLG